jgi:KDO2-lipid IV(A) lauroyltransferase
MSAAWRNLRWFAAYWISRTGAWLGHYVPAGFWYALANPIADLCYLFMFRRRETVQANLRRVVGDARAGGAAREVFRNFARYVIDFYQLPSLSKQALCERIDFDDWRRLEAALSGGPGAVFVTMHLGQAELGAGALAAYGYPVNVIAENLHYPAMDGFIQGLRRDLGMKVIAVKQAKLGVLRCLSRGETLAMMVDAVDPGEGVLVDFFGAPAEFSTAPARIAVRTGSRILPGVVARAGSDPKRLSPIIDFDLCYEPTGDEETDVRALTQAAAHSLEALVKRFPGQWFAFHPVWDGDASAGGATRTVESANREAGGLLVKLLYLAARLGPYLPRSLAYGLARLAADAAFKLRGAARRAVEDNMRHVMGPDAPPDKVNAAAREAFRNVGRYYVDLVRIRQMDLRAQIGRSVRLHGFDRLKSRLDGGQGVVVATAHFGNPELAVQVGAILGLDILVLAEPLRPTMAQFMHRLRSAFGLRYADVSFKVVGEALRHLRAGGCLAITCDRDIQDKGSPVPFFGVETRMPLGAVEMAAHTGAALVPGYCRRAEDGGFDIYFEEPVELVDTGQPKQDALVNTRALLTRVENWIRADPGQWMPLERIWKPVASRNAQVRAKTASKSA